MPCAGWCVLAPNGVCCPMTCRPGGGYQQTPRWLATGCFEALVHDLRMLLRVAAGRDPQPRGVIFDRRTLQSSTESGDRVGYGGAKRRKGAKVHMAVDTLGQLLALLVTPANQQDRDQVAARPPQSRT